MKVHELKITDRQIAHLREEISRVKKQASFLRAGVTKTNDGKDRISIIMEIAQEIDRVLCNI